MILHLFSLALKGRYRVKVALMGSLDAKRYVPDGIASDF